MASIEMALTERLMRLFLWGLTYSTPPNVTPMVNRNAPLASGFVVPLAEGLEGIPFDRGFIEHKLEISLERLGVDRVAFYLSHAPDDETPVEQTIEGFAAVIESGQVEHIGCCNVNARQLVEYLDTAERLGMPGFEWVQNGFSLLTPTADRELRAVCKERGLGYTPFSPLAGGVLTGKYKRGEPFPEGTRMALRPEGHADLLTESVYDALEKLAEVAAQHNVSVASLALAWVMGHPDCTAPVVGPSRTAPHLPHIADAMALKLTEGEHAQLTAWFEEATNPA
jgi:aryl-alcohol dehydrogenase-like predicted oxidoreductase